MYTLTKDSLILNKEPILRRMFDTNDYIVAGKGNYYWANIKTPGCLIEGLTLEEKDDLFRLTAEGKIVHEKYARS